MLRRAILFALFLVLFVTSGFAQPANLINTLPMYGGVPKSAAQLEADRKFIEEVAKQAGSREMAAERAVQLGWQSFYGGDMATAMKRFNQAWLLTPENPGVFWGFGAVTGSQRKFDESLKFFERSRVLAPKNPRMLVDFALTLSGKAGLGTRDRAEREALFARAHGLLNEAEQMEQKYPLLYANRAILYFFQGDYVAAWRNVDRAQALEPRSVSDVFLKDLASRMPQPTR